MKMGKAREVRTQKPYQKEWVSIRTEKFQERSFILKAQERFSDNQWDRILRNRPTKGHRRMSKMHMAFG
jgi:hypothetical protein